MYRRAYDMVYRDELLNLFIHKRRNAYSSYHNYYSQPKRNIESCFNGKGCSYNQPTNVPSPQLCSTIENSFPDQEQEQENEKLSLSTKEVNTSIADSFKEIYPMKTIGKYEWRIRVMKIINYKIKKIKKLEKRPIVTKYSGRSTVASRKARVHGRFVRTK